MEFILTITLLCISYAVFAFFRDFLPNLIWNKALQEHIDRDNIQIAQRDSLYKEKVEEPLRQYYAEICENWHRPDDPLSADRLRFQTEADLQHAQATLPNEWFMWADNCDCWLCNEMLYFLEQFSSIKESAENFPEQFDTEEKIESSLFHISIPLENIHYFKENGELIRSQRTVLPASTSYTGVSVNGIGFGDVTHTPEVTVPRLLDSRYVTLYYRIEGKSALQTLYFGHDSLETLIRLIPQFEK